MNANYRKLPVNFRIIADSAAKLQKNLITEKTKRENSLSNIYFFVQLFNLQPSIFNLQAPFYIILMHIIWEEILHKSYTYLVVWNIEGV